jgi:hypothetical protein
MPQCSYCFHLLRPSSPKICLSVGWIETECKALQTLKHQVQFTEGHSVTSQRTLTYSIAYYKYYYLYNMGPYIYVHVSLRYFVIFKFT